MGPQWGFLYMYVCVCVRVRSLFVSGLRWSKHTAVQTHTNTHTCTDRHTYTHMTQKFENNDSYGVLIAAATHKIRLSSACDCRIFIYTLHMNGPGLNLFVRSFVFFFLSFATLVVSTSQSSLFFALISCVRVRSSFTLSDRARTSDSSNDSIKI